jgi:hypothetical protein
MTDEICCHHEVAAIEACNANKYLMEKLDDALNENIAMKFEVLCLQKEIEFLRNRVFELDVDRRRLDWLDNHVNGGLISNGERSWAMDESRFQNRFEDEDGGFVITFYIDPDEFAGSVRSAIDAVRLEGSVLKGDDND